MRIDKSCGLFFGTKIDSKLREGLALSKPGDKKYFDGSSEEFLRVIEIGDDKDKERWIGKVIKPGPAVTEVDETEPALVLEVAASRRTRGSRRRR